MWVWTAVTSIPFARKDLATCVTSGPTRAKSPVMAALPAPSGWKLITVPTPSAGVSQALVLKLGHHRADLGLGEDQIAHDGDLPTVGGEGGVGAEREAGLEGDAVEGHLQVGAGEAVAMDVAGHDITLSSDGVVD